MSISPIRSEPSLTNCEIFVCISGDALMKQVTLIVTLILFLTPFLAYSEINASGTPEDQIININPGDEYLVYSAGGIGVNVDWHQNHL